MTFVDGVRMFGRGKKIKIKSRLIKSWINQSGLVFMALAVIAIAPFKALSTPANAQFEDPCVVVKACCAVMHYCCCEVTPRPPSDLDTASEQPVQPKFIAIKGGGKVVDNSLPRFSQSFVAQAASISRSHFTKAPSRPLYILNRALLI